MRWLRSRRVWLFVLAGILVALVGSTLPLKEWFIAIQDWLVSLGPWAMPAFILIYLVATVLGLPNILLILLSGTLFGLLGGIIAASIADTLGAIACFGIGRTIARERIKRWMRKYPNFAQLDQALAQKGWKILLLSRLSPLVPSNVLNYGFSCTKVNFWQYCFFSWLGMLPMIVAYVYLASFSRFLFSNTLTFEKVALQALGLCVTVGVGIYTTRFARKALTLDCPAEKSPQKPPKALK